MTGSDVIQSERGLAEAKRNSQSEVVRGGLLRRVGLTRLTVVCLIKSVFTATAWSFPVALRYRHRYSHTASALLVILLHEDSIFTLKTITCDNSCSNINFNSISISEHFPEKSYKMVLEK